MLDFYSNLMDLQAAEIHLKIKYLETRNDLLDQLDATIMSY